MTGRQADERGAMAPSEAPDTLGRSIAVEVTPRQLGGIAVVALLVLGAIGLVRRRRTRPHPGEPTVAVAAGHEPGA